MAFILHTNWEQEVLVVKQVVEKTNNHRSRFEVPGEDSDSEDQTSNTAPEQVRGRRGASSFVTSRSTGPQTSQHLSLESRGD